MTPEKEDDSGPPSGAQSPEEVSRVKRLDFGSAIPLQEEQPESSPRARRLFPEVSPALALDPVRVFTPSFDSSEEREENTSENVPQSIADRTGKHFQAAEASADTAVQTTSGPRLLFGGSTHQAFPVPEEDILALNADAAQDDLLSMALGIARSFSVSDPASRFAVFASDLQADYGRLREQALELSMNPDMRLVRERLLRLLDAVDSIDFAAILAPAKGLLGFFTKSVDPTAFREAFSRKLQEVTQLKKELTDGLDILDDVRKSMMMHEERRKVVLHALQAHILAGRVIHAHLADERKDSLFARLLSLETTAATAESEQHGEVLAMSLDGLIGSIRDTILTWVPVWLSTANDALLLLEQAHSEKGVDAYRRLLEARSKILTLRK